ncbi:MAG: hypothetical protein QNK37_00115 [Acidobacteriota bacterium]|nr:hypothetical protein [Acidobacteriota bacterium]
MIHWIRKLFQSFFRSSGDEPEKGEPSGSRHVILREIREERDSRFLDATLHDDRLEIMGLDRGDSVERYFGEREYEWRWSVEAEGLAKLQEVLDVDDPDQLLPALKARFSGEAAAGLQTFLDTNQVSYKAWSRTGD